MAACAIRRSIALRSEAHTVSRHELLLNDLGPFPRTKILVSKKTAKDSADALIQERRLEDVTLGGTSRNSIIGVMP